MPNYRYSERNNFAANGIREPSPDLAGISDAAWAIAKKRFRVIRMLAEKPGRTRVDAMAAAHQIGCSVTRVYVLLDRYSAEPTVTGLLMRKRGVLIGTSKLARETDALIDQAIETVYLSSQRPRLADLMDEVARRCHARGIPSPGRKAVTTRVRNKPRATIVARRQGKKAARDRFAPVLGSLESAGPLALVQIDHTLVDVIVVDSVTRAPIQRPWLTLAIDVYSRCVAGFYLSLEAPSATSVALCLSNVALPKEGWLAQHHIDTVWPVSGIPRALHLDNAKEFRSEALRRGCEQYGIKIDYRPVRTPHYGGHIERLIGTLMGKVHLLPGTTYSNIQQKGDTNPEKTATMTIDEIEAWLGHAIAGVYHGELHRALGTTPLAAWNSATGKTVPPKSVCDARRFLIDFLPMERRQVRREGVLLHSIAYWSDVLREWVGDPEPMIVRYDPRDLSRIYLLGPDGNYYDLSYRDIRRMPISRWEQRRALTKLREDGYAHVDESAIFRTVEKMRALTDAASVTTKAARRERERRDRMTPPAVHRMAPQSASSANNNSSELVIPQSVELLPVEEW